MYQKQTENNLFCINSIKTINKPGILNCINNFNFNLKRFFYFDNFNNDLEKKRGLHVNINFNEVLLVIKGKVEIKLIDKNLMDNNIVIE